MRHAGESLTNNGGCCRSDGLLLAECRHQLRQAAGRIGQHDVIGIVASRNYLAIADLRFE